MTETGASFHSFKSTASTAKIAHRPPRRPNYFVLKLNGALSDIETIKEATGPGVITKTFTGEDDAGRAAVCCRVDNAGREKVISYLDSIGASAAFQPTFIRDSKASKVLSDFSVHPTLGIEATLPQHRINSLADSTLLPKQNQYPVWCFCYGKLAQPGVLKRLLALEEDAVYRRAKIVQGGVLRTWGAKYNALMDAPETARNTAVDGSAFLVQNEEQEDVLCRYETVQYEVVRCSIEMVHKKEAVRGLVFRFVGEVDED